MSNAATNANDHGGRYRIQLGVILTGFKPVPRLNLAAAFTGPAGRLFPRQFRFEGE